MRHTRSDAEWGPDLATAVADQAWLAAPCTVRGYGFDANGRRTTLAATVHPDGNCAGPAGATTTVGYAYDTADRPTTAAGGAGQYAYDPMGRQTTLPAADEN